MEICLLKKSDEKAWNEYVFNQPNSTFYHQIGWKNVVEQTYKHKPFYLIAKGSDKIGGVLPLFLMKSRIFGIKLISIPFAPYGGIIADNEYVENALLLEAEKIAKENGSNYLELRNSTEKSNARFVTNNSYVTFIIALDQGLDIIWQNLRRDKKKGIQKGKKANFLVEWNTNIDNFYDIEVHSMKDLGTPVHSYDFFNNIVNEFPESTKILTIKYRNIVVCCKFLLFYKDTVISMWASTLNDYKEFHPYDFANWEAIEYSYNAGYKYFDFGRCLLNSGVFQYKEGWTEEYKQLYYQFYSSHDLPLPDFGQSNPDRKTFARIWKKLPMPITKIMGPMLRRNFP